MKHKYLHELFPNDNLPFPYNEDDYADFDKRDTYNMDYTLIAWLYERLRFFKTKLLMISTWMKSYTYLAKKC